MYILYIIFVGLLRLKFKKKKLALDPSKTCPRDYEKLLSGRSDAHVSRTALWSRAAAIRSGRTAAAALEENNNNSMQFGRRRTTATQTNTTIGRFVEHDQTTTTATSAAVGQDLSKIIIQ